MYVACFDTDTVKCTYERMIVHCLKTNQPKKKKKKNNSKKIIRPKHSTEYIN